MAIHKRQNQILHCKILGKNKNYHYGHFHACLATVARGNKIEKLIIHFFIFSDKNGEGEEELVTRYVRLQPEIQNLKTAAKVEKSLNFLSILFPICEAMYLFQRSTIYQVFFLTLIFFFLA